MFEVMGEVYRDKDLYVATELSSEMNELGRDIISLYRDKICSKL